MIKRLKAFIATITIVFMYNSNAYAQKTIIGTREMPLELNLLIDNYQAMSPENYAKILPIIMNIDIYARNMTKEDIFFIGKIEIYKTLLKNYDAPIKLPVDGTTIATLHAALARAIDNFTKWFLQALLKDSQDLIDSPVYKEYLLQKNSNTKIEKVEYRKLEKKAELLQYWIAKINPESQDYSDTLRNDLAPKMLEALKNIQNSFYFVAKEANLSPMPPALKDETELKFFAVNDTAPLASPRAKDSDSSKSVDDILAPLTDQAPSVLPRPSQENWLEDENAPASLQNLPKPSNDADWLQDF